MNCADLFASGVNGYLALFCQAVVITLIWLKCCTLGRGVSSYACRSGALWSDMARHGSASMVIGILKRKAFPCWVRLDSAAWELLTVYVALAGPSRPQRPESSLALETSTLK